MEQIIQEVIVTIYSSKGNAQASDVASTALGIGY